jgi:hypothetical protein
VAVQFDRSLTEATLLGFVPTVAKEEFPISQLKSLEDLLEHLNQLEHPQLVKERVQLRQWLHNIVEAGWEAVEALFDPPQAQLAYHFRSASPMRSITSENPASGIQRGKLLNLERAGEQVALLVGLKPIAGSEMDISVEVYPTEGKLYLPQDLQLMVLDNRGEAVMQAQARSTKTIQLKFSGELGESFGVKLALGDVSITEAFLI